MISWCFRKPRAFIFVSVCMAWIHPYCLIGWFWPIRQYDSPLQLCHTLVPHKHPISIMTQPIRISYSLHACKPSPKSFPHTHLDHQHEAWGSVELLFLFQYVWPEFIQGQFWPLVDVNVFLCLWVQPLKNCWETGPSGWEDRENRMI